MIYREYGKTGKKISAIGFGGMRFENPNDLERSASMLTYALDCGINYFDTAPYYFMGKSERVFGHAIPELKKTGKDFYISTKSLGKDIDTVRMDLEKSLERLGVDNVDFYHVWCVLTPDDYSQRKLAGVIDEFYKIQEEGLATHISISTHMEGADIKKMLETEKYAGITLGYNAINFPFREEGISAAAKKNMGIVIMNPLGGGMIAENPAEFDFIKMKKEQTIVDASIHFLLSNPSITTALVGFSKKEHIDAAILAVDSFTPYTNEQINTLKARIENDFKSLCTTCGYCKECPQDIRVWAFMESYNHKLIKSQYSSALARLKIHWGLTVDELDKCIECGKCEELCTQHLPILERFKLLKELANT